MPEDLLEALLEPDDDKAWKLAVGHAIREIRADGKAMKAQVTLTNGRVTALEAWRHRITGALIIGSAAMPLFTFLLSLAWAR